jgi:hypothetical protein
VTADRGAPCRVFLSRTSEFADADADGSSFLRAAHSAIARAGHAVVEMSQFTASPHPPALLCAEKVRGADVFVLLAGSRYGSLVRRDPPESYCEFEHRIAGEAGKPRLAFLLADAAPASATRPGDDPGLQQDFCRRLRRDCVVATFTSPDNLALDEIVPDGCGRAGPTMNLSIGSADGVDSGRGVRRIRPGHGEEHRFDPGTFHF